VLKKTIRILIFPTQVPEFSPDFGGIRVDHIIRFSVVLLCVLTFWVSYCDVRYDFHIKTFCLSLPTVVCSLMSYLRYVCLFVQSGVRYILDCVFFRLLYNIFLVSRIFQFWLQVRYSLMFKQINTSINFNSVFW
jgi:hypothetical protein